MKCSKLVLATVFCLLTAACSNSDDSQYLGIWKKVKYPKVVLEITNEGNDKAIMATTDLREWKRPVRKHAVSVSHGVLMDDGTAPILIQKDGILVYQGQEYVKLTDQEILELKQTLATPQEHSSAW